VNNGFGILKVNGLILIIEEMWSKSLIHLNINVEFKIVTCVLINYGKCKMQLLSNGFSMLKVDVQFMYHVNSWKNVKQITNSL
jgi:hypothetical protein